MLVAVAVGVGVAVLVGVAVAVDVGVLVGAGPIVYVPTKVSVPAVTRTVYSPACAGFDTQLLEGIVTTTSVPSRASETFSITSVADPSATMLQRRSALPPCEMEYPLSAADATKPDATSVPVPPVPASNSIRTGPLAPAAGMKPKV